MLDIHLPHKSIRGFSEFLIHLFTITVGLLIAVQIENFFEWRHHMHLAEEARVALRAEIQHNLEELQTDQPGLKAWRGTIDDDFNTMQKIQNHPNDSQAQHTPLTVNFSSISLPDTAWKTAQSTNALAYMPYKEAEQYSNIYQAQAALLKYQEKPEEDVAAILGLIAKYNTHATPTSTITAEQAGALAEKFNQMRSHLLNGDLLLRRCIDTDQAFLENRAPTSSISDSLK
jgi:hypothetical protein